MTQCPCCSGAEFARCCEPFLSGTRSPETAEQAMRARYTAYTRADIDYLMSTLHPDNREEGDEESAKQWAADSEWLGLEVVATERGAAGDDEGLVEFVARYRDRKGVVHAHHERSLFVRQDGRWVFREGATPSQAPMRRDGAKVGRNDPCPCGSGKKFKKCCEKA